ncbi:hypothetical protein PS028_24025, partial [Shigella sonnei]|nr:hypothetical protein [Shigella sonnei]
FLFPATPATYGSSQARVEPELQLPAYTTATATPDQSDKISRDPLGTTLQSHTIQELIGLYFPLPLSHTTADVKDNI